MKRSYAFMTGSWLLRLKALLLLLTLVAASPAIALQVSIMSNYPASCGNPSGRLEASAFGGVQPYSYSWSNGATTALITGLLPSTYTVTVTDADGTVAMTTDEVLNTDELQISPLIDVLYFDVEDPTFGAPCPGECNGMIGFSTNSLNGMPPYDIQIWGNGAYTPLYDGIWVYVQGVCAGESLSATVIDAYGCGGTIYATLYGPASIEVSVVQTHGACGGPNGSVTLSWTPVYYNINSTITILNAQDQVVYHYINPPSVITGLAPGTYTARVTMPQTVGPCTDEVQFTIPDLGTNCGVISGGLFLDHDQDCEQDAGEPPLVNRVLEILPGPLYAITNNAGEYELALDYGTYTISQPLDDVFQLCPPVSPVPFTISSGESSAVINFADSSLIDLDIHASLQVGPVRPGFTTTYHGLIKNLGGQLSAPLDVEFTFDPIFSFQSAFPAGYTVSGSTITWNGLPALGAWESMNVSVQLQLPPDPDLLGTMVTGMLAVDQSLPETTLTNNTSSRTSTITGSYDPNDKLVSTSTGASTTKFYIGEDEWLDYTIRFQNTGTDTAFTVVITDTLAIELDMASFQQGVASHPFEVSFKQGRVIEWRFENILLPDSNVNEPGSHGLVNFRIKPISSITPGTQIINIANIYFDFNPPVITDPSVLVAAVPPVHVQVKAFLSGPYESGSGNMHDALRLDGMLPLAEPYTGLGYAHAGGGGGETTTAEVLSRTGNNATVDWVVVELRNASTPSQIQYTRSALIRRDGQVVDVDGISPVAFSAGEGNYHVAIRHRNHLGCMRTTPLSLAFTPTSIDLTTNSTTTWGTNARDNISGTMVLWTGDVNSDGVVKYTGAGNDRDPILIAIGGSTPTNVVMNYGGGDVNMDGTFKYTGTENDRDIILQTIGGVVPTNVRVEQLP